MRSQKASRAPLTRSIAAWVQDIKVEVDDGKIVEWRVTLKVTFVLN
jgi:flavin-binding protein dodecin